MDAQTRTQTQRQRPLRPTRESSSDADNDASTDEATGALATTTANVGRGTSAARRASGKRIGGVAPTLRPPSRWQQWRTGRRVARRGFVPLSPGREKRRHRILPRTVIGISSMLLAFAVGVGLSGAAFYAYYDNRLAQNEQEVARFVDGFDQQFTDASAAIDDLRVQAVDDIRAELAPIGEYTTDAEGIIGLPVTAGASVWLVETLDDSGRPVVGSAFAVTGHEGGTALVTSLSVVRASAAGPAPAIELVKGDQRIPAQLWSWDEGSDLALLVVDLPIPVLTLAPPAARTAALGTRVFAMSGFGGQGASASPGVLIDQSASGLQHTAPVGTFFEGGPLLAGGGQVIGLATTSFTPFGDDTGPISVSPSIDQLCATLLQCADDTTGGVTVTPGD